MVGATNISVLFYISQTSQVAINYNEEMETRKSIHSRHFQCKV